MKTISFTFLISCFLFFTPPALGQDYDLKKSLNGFDEYIEKVISDWNAVGIAVGIVINDKLVYSKGFGYRDLDKKLPVTSKTLFPIASNTKLFTTISMGMLVEKEMLQWDKPISQFVPNINFYNKELYNTVTLRDMLAHRTGISRHDNIWYQSDFSRKELYDRIKYLEPSQPIRESFLYNNLMYSAAGHILELKTGKTWEKYVTENLFVPLDMKNSIFTIEEMEQQKDFAIPYYEEKETDKLLKYPFYRQMQGAGPAGSIISNIEDMSHWMIALMNNGKYNEKEVISKDILKETLQPSIAIPNRALESNGYDELLNAVYGMGRSFAVYKGHYLTGHGGAIGGFYSQVSMMPYDSIGVLVFVNGTHTRPLIDIVTYNIYDRLLQLEQTDFHNRKLEKRVTAKAAYAEGDKKEGSDKVANTSPSHQLSDYVGRYEDPAYGILEIELVDDKLKYNFHNTELVLNHYHYDRFDTPNDPIYGKSSVNFSTNPQGDIYRLTMSLDQYEVDFTKLPNEELNKLETLKQYVGQFELGGTLVTMKIEDGKLYTYWPGQPKMILIPYKKNIFKYENFSDWTVEFITTSDKVDSFKDIGPNGVYVYLKKEKK